MMYLAELEHLESGGQMSILNLQEIQEQILCRARQAERANEEHGRKSLVRLGKILTELTPALSLEDARDRNIICEALRGLEHSDYIRPVGSGAQKRLDYVRRYLAFKLTEAGKARARQICADET